MDKGLKKGSVCPIRINAIVRNVDVVTVKKYPQKVFFLHVPDELRNNSRIEDCGTFQGDCSRAIIRIASDSFSDLTVSLLNAKRLGNGAWEKSCQLARLF